MFIFNCTTNVTGGAVQNSVNFIHQALLSSECKKWVFVVNKKIYSQLDLDLEESKQFKIFESPAKSIKARREISNYISSKPNWMVYTSAGPAYLSIKNYHVVGCSNPYILGIDKEVNIRFFLGLQYLKRELLTIYQRKAIQSADAYIFQTKHSQDNFFKYAVKKDIKKSIVVPNAISTDFKKHADLNFIPSSLYCKNVISVLVPSAYYKHKCLETIPYLILILNKHYPEFKFIFYLTITDLDFALIKRQNNFNVVSNQIINLGPYSHSDAINLYRKMDAIFQPSLIEVFSTTYIEAISMGMPLIVPDIPFTRDICYGYPNYYDFNNLEDCARAFSPKVIFDNKIRDRSILDKYGTQRDRFIKIQNYLYRLKRESNV